MTMRITGLLTLIMFTLAMDIVRGQDSDALKKTKPRRAVVLPEEKETTLGLYLTAQEAYEKWQADPARVKVLDVRFPEEYVFVGHAEMAWNIPVALISYEPHGDKPCSMKPNPRFITDVKMWAQPNEIILVMCRSGGRGAMAVNALADAGFTNAYNIVDGMEGDMVDDPDNVYFGKRMKNGWKNSGLPWTYDVNPEQMRLPNQQNGKQ